MASLENITAHFRQIQDRICAELQELDGSAQQFHEDQWQRKAGGGGRSRVFRAGDIIEKGGVNFSHVHGPMPGSISKKLNLPEGAGFHATGVSIVLHASHPYIPIIHMNVRYFEMENGHYWFGGGIDVTPAYIEQDQAIQFHRRMKTMCDLHDAGYYEKYKAWCDQYFFLPHRNETRGIGGLFFDQLKGNSGEGKSAIWEFVKDLADSFVPAYTDLVNANRRRNWGEREKQWQLIRRSRYVEFNLLHDRGTKFGLDTGGRTESILMSMPPLAAWEYDHHPTDGSPEAQTHSMLIPKDWLKDN